MALQWEGELANVAEFDANGIVYGYLYCDWSRTNNTISVTGVHVQQKATSTVYFDWEWQAGAWVQGVYVVNAQTKGRTGGANLVNNVYGAGAGAHSFGVGTGGGTFSLQGNWRSDHYGDQSAARTVNIAYGAATAPAGTSYNNGITTTTYSAYAGLSTWGDYSTAGSVRSYIADNVGFTGQTYLAASNWGTVTHTGLTSNTRYWTRGWADNGAGLSAYFASVNNYTLPLAPVIGTIVPKYNKATVPTTINVGGGSLSITKQYRFKLNSSGTWGSWTTYTGDDIVITGLNANKLYDLQVQSTTTAGTTVSGTTAFETQPSPGKFLPVLMGL